eukprot:gene34320-44333_t
MALQGAVEEHMNSIRKLGATAIEIRYPKDLEAVDGIILPGGESTAMAIVGEKCGLFPVLKNWVASKKPIWGTCAGMILLSDHAIKQKEGGQSLLGGLDVHVCRNYFGSQIYSSHLPIEVTDAKIASSSDIDSCTGIFIRAPAILDVGPAVQVIATTRSPPHASAIEEVVALLTQLGNRESDQDDEGTSTGRKRLRREVASDNKDHVYNVIVAVRQENILATAFHPELTDDLRWHRFFLDIVADAKNRVP